MKCFFAVHVHCPKKTISFRKTSKSITADTQATKNVLDTLITGDFQSLKNVTLFGHLTTNGARLEGTYQYVIIRALKINRQFKKMASKILEKIIEALMLI